MINLRVCSLCVVSSLLITLSCYQALCANGSAATTAQASQPSRGRGPAGGDTTAWQNPSGPYTVVMEEDAALPSHTIYRPTDLTAFPKKDSLPLVTFSGPGCIASGTAFRPFYTEVASHGFMVIANGPVQQRGSGQTKASDHVASIDWAVAENGRKDSKYYQRIETSKIAIMGQSCGGLEVMGLAKEPRITTLVLWNSGILNQSLDARGQNADRRGPGEPNRGAMPATRAQDATRPAGARGAGTTSSMSASKDALKSLRTPIAYFVGGTDMAKPNASDDFERIDNVPVFLGVLEIPGDAHGGTFREKNGGKFGVAGVAWLEWQLKGDENSAKMFKGAECGLSKDPEWTVKKKKID
jgi:hypothetical protein